MANDKIDQNILQIFIEEATDLVVALTATLGQWEHDLNNLSEIQNLKRDLHTLKGGARMVKQPDIGTLAHELETYVDALAKGEIKIDRPAFDLVYEAIDRLNSMVESLRKSETVNPAQDLIDKFHSRLPKIETFAKEPLPKEPEKKTDKKEEISESKKDEPSTKPTTGQVPEVIRISIDLIEKLNSLSTENSLVRVGLEQYGMLFRSHLQDMKLGTKRIEGQLEALNSEVENWVERSFFEATQNLPAVEYQTRLQTAYSMVEQFNASIRETNTDFINVLKEMMVILTSQDALLLTHSRISTELQRRVASTTLVPFESVVPRLGRIVRQISSELHKQVNFEVTKSEGEMDRVILERLIPSLEHILRNALDHGIELPAERKKRGKPEVGRIEISFARVGSMILIEIKDDGGGIDLAAIRKKAISQGMLDQEATYTDDEIIRIILVPGFSTREAVTEVSGRGVGMDVVNIAIKEMGGNLSITSELGKGTSMTLRFPFTISLNRILLFKMQDEILGILLATLDNVENIQAVELEKGEFQHAGKNYSLHYLGALLHPEKKSVVLPKKAIFPVLLFSGSDYAMAIIVDEVLYNRELVVQSLCGQFKLSHEFSGATQLGDGRVVFLLDPFALSAKAKALSAKEKKPTKLVMKSGRNPKQIWAMVVDDSVSVRTVTQHILERNHFHVITAKDGVDALEKLETHIPDIIVLDIDMPHMDGFEFVETMRKNDKYKNIPVIVATSSVKKHQKRAEELHLSNIVEKPYQETSLLSMLKSLLGKRL